MVETADARNEFLASLRRRRDEVPDQASTPHTVMRIPILVEACASLHPPRALNMPMGPEYAHGP